MNIESIKNNIHSEEVSVKSENVDNLNNNLSSSYCPSLSFSYEIKNELKTDLYGKENVVVRKYNLLKIPNYIK